MAKKLTARGLDSIKPLEKRKEIPDGLVSGLYLVVQPSGKRSWAVRYRVGVRPRKHTLGSASAIDLGAARRLARAALIEVAAGNDPGEAKKAARNAKPKLTVAELLSTYIEKYAKQQTKPSTAHETERALKKELEPLGKRAADSIKRRDLKDLIDDHVTDNQIATAIRVRALLSKMFKWAVEEDYLTVNPCVNMGKIKAPDSVERNLSAAEILNVVSCANIYESSFGNYLLFLLCTGQRRTMTAQTPWKEINLKHKIWTIPKERTKNGKEHVVHLSNFASSLLVGLPSYKIGDGDNAWAGIGYVFANQEGNPISGFSDRKNAFDEFMATNKYKVAPWTLHDLRRTAATSMSELGTEQVIIDLILSHQTNRTKDVSAIYNRNQHFKKRQEAMERWGEYLQNINPWNLPVDRGVYGEKADALAKRKAAEAS